jgi:hypothetical protein
MCSSAVMSDAFDTRCVVNASVCLRFLLHAQRVNCSILLEETWGGGWKSSDFHFNPLVQYLILSSQNYQIIFKGFKMFVSIPLQSICVPQKIQHQPVKADKLYHLYDGISES